MEQRDLCRACLEDLPRNRPACPRCGLSLEADCGTECGRCQQHPPAYVRSVIPFRYEEPVRHMVHALKFHARYPYARLFGQLLAGELAGRTDLPSLLIPVPLHASRYRQRGFNQAAEIARTLSHRFDIPLGLNCCARHRLTRPQMELSAEERAQIGRASCRERVS
jgi:predicted amidophosphoribosyltransferase